MDVAGALLAGYLGVIPPSLLPVAVPFAGAAAPVEGFFTPADALVEADAAEVFEAASFCLTSSFLACNLSRFDFFFSSSLGLVAAGVPLAEVAGLANPPAGFANPGFLALVSPPVALAFESSASPGSFKPGTAVPGLDISFF